MAGIRSGVAFVGRGSVRGGGGGLRLGREVGFTIHYPHPQLVKLVRLAGAREVHLRISSPPITHPCHYGIDTPVRKDLIASSHSVDQIAEYLRVDSLAYLSIPGLMQSVRTTEGFCQACFTGNYPVEFEDTGKDVFESGVRVGRPRVKAE